nr:rab proteins geranylgeranyltransferase component a [Quercus suber]
METLNDTSWDVVIDGTDLPQSLLALALSRSELRVLHLDQNKYYGGTEAALSLDEAQDWAKRFQGEHGKFRHALVTRPYQVGTAGAALAASRAYTLTLSSQLIYGRSNLLQALVSSRTHEQLDFQAVGSFWVVEPSKEDAAQTRLLRVPSGREDIFQDESIRRPTKRSLMNFIRSITSDDVTSEQPQTTSTMDLAMMPFPEVLAENFSLPPETHSQLLALTLSPQPPSDILYKDAVSSIRRHLLSMGMFGSGFGAVMPKYGGLSEIVQVACRASAVGGGVYVLDKSIRSSAMSNDGSSNSSDVKLELDNGESITTRWLIKSRAQIASAPVIATTKSISIISSPLGRLFPPTSVEGGVTPAGAVIMIPALDKNDPPVHVMAHSDNSGECPQNQCVLYASVLSSTDRQRSVSRLETVVDNLLFVLGRGSAIASEDPGEGMDSSPKVLWRLGWEEIHSPATIAEQGGDGTLREICIQPVTGSLALEDRVLVNVQSVWQKITNRDEADFMRFAAREEGDAVGGGESDT